MAEVQDMKPKTRKVVDHAVLFKMKDDMTEEQEKEMLEALFTLQYQAKGVLYLSVGPVLEKTVDGVTHALFSRFANKEDAELYMQHPARKTIARELVIPYGNVQMWNAKLDVEPLYQMVLAMLDVEDEVTDDLEAIFGREFAQGGGIDHFVLFKVKEGTSQESIEAMLQSFRELANSLNPSILFQLTAGTNISPVGKGYTHGFIARIPSEAALEAFVNSDGYVHALSKEALPDCTEFISADLPSAFRGSSVTLHE